MRNLDSSELEQVYGGSKKCGGSKGGSHGGGSKGGSHCGGSGNGKGSPS